jgi:hypothetical protein
MWQFQCKSICWLMTDCCFTVSSKTASSITAIVNSLNILIVKSMITLLRSVMKFRNAASASFQSMMIMNVCLRAISLCITASTAILSTQLDSSSAKYKKNSWRESVWSTQSNFKNSQLQSVIIIKQMLVFSFHSHSSSHRFLRSHRTAWQTRNSSSHQNSDRLLRDAKWAVD